LNSINQILKEKWSQLDKRAMALVKYTTPSTLPALMDPRYTPTRLFLQAFIDTARGNISIFNVDPVLWMATALIIRQVDNYRSEPLRVTRAEPLRIATLTFPGKVFTRSSDDLDDEWVPQGRRLWIKLVIVVGVEPFSVRGCGVEKCWGDDGDE
jgi:hypothetical protein